MEMEKQNQSTSAGAAASHNSNESTEDSKMIDESTNSVRRRSRSRSSEKTNQGKYKSISGTKLTRLSGLGKNGQNSTNWAFWRWATGLRDLGIWDNGIGKKGLELEIGKNVGVWLKV